MVCSRNQKSTNVFRCLRVGTLTGCPLRSNKERISSAMMLHFFPSAVFITRQWGENDDAFFKTAIDIFSIRKTLVSDHFDKLAFSLNKKFTDDVIFSHAEMLTGCPLDANNIIKFRAYRRLIYCYLTRMSRETWMGMRMASSSSMKIFHRMYQACMWSCSLDLLILPGLWPPHPSYVAYCNTLKGPSQAPTREP